ncbi:hypothetical protein J6590_039114 [Homalodisca vitripennis]|nr:hypothetical protein J6590_039114 [Homalodisca vitripennis]
MRHTNVKVNDKNTIRQTQTNTNLALCPQKHSTQFCCSQVRWLTILSQQHVGEFDSFIFIKRKTIHHMEYWRESIEEFNRFVRNEVAFTISSL